MGYDTADTYKRRREYEAHTGRNARVQATDRCGENSCTGLYVDRSVNPAVCTSCGRERHDAQEAAGVAELAKV